jgi:hypothetical protein
MDIEPRCAGFDIHFRFRKVTIVPHSNGMSPEATASGDGCVRGEWVRGVNSGPRMVYFTDVAEENVEPGSGR